MQHQYSFISKNLVSTSQTQASIYISPKVGMKMVREAQDDHSTLSLMALLQERFRQLQKMKELRQEQELLRILSESKKHIPPPQQHCNSNYTEKYSMYFPPQPNCQLSLSLCPDSSPMKRMGPSNASKSCFAGGPLFCTSPINMDNSGSDIDTSLRL